MGLGVNVRRLREQAGMQQAELAVPLESGLAALPAELADKVQISRTMMCQIERSMKIPSLPVGVAIAKALGTTAEQLLEE